MPQAPLEGAGGRYGNKRRTPITNDEGPHNSSKLEATREFVWCQGSLRRPRNHTGSARRRVLVGPPTRPPHSRGRGWRL